MPASALFMKSISPFRLAAVLVCGASITAWAADAAKEAKAPPAPTAPPAAAPGEPAPAPAKPYVLPEVVATVEGIEIKKDELQKSFNTMLAAQGVSAEAVPAAQLGQAYHMILDELIVEKLLTKRSAEVKVTDADVTAAFEKFKGNFGSPEEMKAQLEKNGQSEDALKLDIRNSLQEQHWLDSQIKDTAPVTEADAKAFYEGNPQQFQKPEQVRASHILLKLAPDAKPAEVVEKEKQASAIAARAKGGEDFAKLATELSEDPSAKQNAGDLNYFSKEQMVPEFSDAAFAMKKDDISDPVRSQFGYHIIKVTDHKGGEKMTLDQVKPQLIAFLQRQKKQKEMTALIKSVREKADVKVNLE